MDLLETSLKQNFDIRDSINIIRMISGAFYLPHVIYKIVGIDASLAFFAKAGLEPAGLFLLLSLLTETTCSIGLFFGILVRWVGILSAGAMMVACYATFATKGLGWYWNKGGIEYLIFWAIVSLALAWIAWQRHWAKIPAQNPLDAFARRLLAHGNAAHF